LVVVAAGVAGVLGLYLQDVQRYAHQDVEFCFSCHVMEDPYERFARSGHRELTCAACHEQTVWGRTRMRVGQLTGTADTAALHAEVPNERCAECHIEGDPERWRLIESTAGHEAHLASDDPELEGLQCVECHASSVHQFVPTRETCGQAGCHEETEVRLGGMADLSIHCVICHDFRQPVDSDTTRTAQEAAAEALRPEMPECLSCHAMREMLPDFPEDGPHDAACADCHNPHEQELPAQASETCTSAGCHARADTISSFHHQAPTIRLSDCGQCHEAHGFTVEEENCLDCHEDIFERDRPPARSALDTRGGPRWRGAPRDQNEPGPGGGPLASGARDPRSPPAVPDPGLPEASPQEAPADTVRFYHVDHREVECQACHSLAQPSLLGTGPSWCRDCHHDEERTAPVATACEDCHDPGEFGAGDFQLVRTMEFSVLDAGLDRELPFRHSTHEEVECTECHRDRPDMSAEGLACDDCHEDHHQAEIVCAECHRAAPEEEHPLEVHVTCSGSGCHASIPFERVPRSRSACLGCHQDLTDHEPQKDCVACHVLPEPAPVSGAAVGTAAGDRPEGVHGAAPGVRAGEDR
jgi:nitrate/TMAO reductase-like tetraheme cytochrome c subunit